MIIFIQLLIIFIIILFYHKKIKDYNACSYYKITKTPYFSMRRDLGKYGEYLTYNYLKKYEKEGAKFLFNIYIPKESGDTTEIDVLMICKKGIFVFESKNFSGWIFGNEKQKYWYQTLPAGKGRSHKERFFNPVMQNRSHIKHLTAFIGDQFNTHSIIVFSERCTLKKIEISSTDINVIKRNQIAYCVSNIYNKTEIENLTEDEINLIYNKLYPLTQISESEKKQHIANIKH